MKIFHCGHCGYLISFESVRCVHCDHVLAYLADVGAMAALEPAGDEHWRALMQGGLRPPYRLCRNYQQENVCNWAIPLSDPHPLCRSCRLTRVIPDLGLPGNRAAWYRLEAAKRRLVYSLLCLGLPVQSKDENPEQGLAFEFLADLPTLRVLTGHNQGVVTLNIAEADDAEREKRRLELGEPYRTLLGHFRHESAHYFWDRLIKDSERLEAFRAVFGDEREPYNKALQRYYQDEAPGEWSKYFVSAYAAAHAWEDWAETWAHYLHMIDSLESAVACGLSLQPARPHEPALRPDLALRGCLPTSFEQMIERWFPLTYVLNHLNRGLGLPDAYPFILSPPAIDKLRFVHQTIAAVVVSA